MIKGIRTLFGMSSVTKMLPVPGRHASAAFALVSLGSLHTHRPRRMIPIVVHAG